MKNFAHFSTLPLKLRTDRAFQFWINASMWRHRVNSGERMPERVRNRLNRDKNEYAARAVAIAPEIFTLTDSDNQALIVVRVVDSIVCDPKHRAMNVRREAIERANRGAATVPKTHDLAGPNEETRGESQS